MIHSCTKVIRSTMPSQIQALALITALAPLFNAGVRDAICKARPTQFVNIWLRNLRGEDICVNDQLVECSGLAADEFVGLTYERSGLDLPLVKQRTLTDLRVLSSRAPIITREISRFGALETINSPIMSSDGTLQGTLHIATLLDQSGCLQNHTSCPGRYQSDLSQIIQRTT
jgi:hypothetical protein